LRHCLWLVLSPTTSPRWSVTTPTRGKFGSRKGATCWVRGKQSTIDKRQSAKIQLWMDIRFPHNETSIIKSAHHQIFKSASPKERGQSLHGGLRVISKLKRLYHFQILKSSNLQITPSSAHQHIRNQHIRIACGWCCHQPLLPVVGVVANHFCLYPVVGVFSNNSLLAPI
jgi:hypothetical protein